MTRRANQGNGNAARRVIWRPVISMENPYAKCHGGEEGMWGEGRVTMADLVAWGHSTDERSQTQSTIDGVPPQTDWVHSAVISLS
jgi:hypothetical protein